MDVGGGSEDVGSGPEGRAVDVTESVYLMIFGHVKRLVDHLGNRLDLCPQLLLDPMQCEPDNETSFKETISITALVAYAINSIGLRKQMNEVTLVPVVESDEVYGHAEVTKSSGSSDSVQICFGHFGKIEVDDDVDGLDVDTASEQI